MKFRDLPVFGPYPGAKQFDKTVDRTVLGLGGPGVAYPDFPAAGCRVESDLDLDKRKESSAH